MSEIVVPITKFKAKCLRLLEQVARDGGTLVITKRGKPLVKVGPIAAASTNGFAPWKHKVDIVGDIVTFDVSDHWETLSW